MVLSMKFSNITVQVLNQYLRKRRNFSIIYKLLIYYSCSYR